MFCTLQVSGASPNSNRKLGRSGTVTEQKGTQHGSINTLQPPVEKNLPQHRDSHSVSWMLPYGNEVITFFFNVTIITALCSEF